MKNNTSNPAAQNYSYVLWFFACSGDFEKVSLILESNVISDIDYTSQDITALWGAAQNGHYETVEQLVKYNANVNFKHPTGQSVLWTAASSGHARIVDILLKNGANIDEISVGCSPLYIAVQNHHLETVEILLLNKKCDINLEQKETGRTPIFTAAFDGEVPIFQALIEANADFKKPDDAGLTPLHVACAGGHSEIVKRLITAGSDVNSKTLDGRTPLFYAYSASHQDVISILLQNGALPIYPQHRINDIIMRFLDVYYLLYSDKYKLYEIEQFKKDMSGGLCYGYNQLTRLMKDLGLQEKLIQQLNLITSWDYTIESLSRNNEMRKAFEALVFNLFALSRLGRIGASDALSDPKIQNTDLLSLITKYQALLEWGFIFKYDELESILQTILDDEIPIDITYINQQTIHAISVSKSKTGFELFDSTISVIDTVKLSSFTELMKLLKLTFNTGDSDRVGLVISVKAQSPSLPLKEKYWALKKSFEQLVINRINDNEINLPDHMNLNALLYAQLASDIQLIQTLLLNGINPLMQNEYFSPMYCAVQLGCYETTNFILSKGVDVNAVYGKNPLLFLATLLRHNQIVNLLLSKGAVVDCVSSGITPLYFACYYGLDDMVNILLDKGANVNFRMLDGETPLFAAISNGNEPLTALLINKGAEVNVKQNLTKNTYSWICTPMSHAIKLGHLNIVKILAAAGADLSNIDGHLTALEFAEAMRQDEIALFLSTIQNGLVLHNEQAPLENGKTKPSIDYSKFLISNPNNQLSATKKEQASDESYAIKCECRII